MQFSKPSQTTRFPLIGVLLLLNLLSNLAAWAAPEVVGHLTEAQGVVEINGGVAATSAELRLGMRVTTGADGRAVLTFADGQTVLLVPNSVFWIKDYRYARSQPRENRSTTELLKGGMRFISGTMAKETPEAVKIETPVATIGIRGTDFTTVLGSLCLLVREGAVVVTTVRQSLVVQASQIVFVQDAGTPPELVPPHELGAPGSRACLDALLKITATDALPLLSAAPITPATTAAAVIGIAAGAALLQDDEDTNASPP